MSRETITLASKLEYLEEAHALNERLLGDEVTLDWSSVDEVSKAYAEALLKGVTIDVHADALGGDTLAAGSVSEVVMAVLERQADQTTSTAQPAPTGPAPAVVAYAKPKKLPSKRPRAQREVQPATDSKTPEQVRARLIRAIEADLVGPFYGDDETEEVLPLPPSRWYLTGFLAPQGRRDTDDPTSDEDAGAGPDTDDEDDSGPEPDPKRARHFPASLGMSMLLPAGDADSIRISVDFADYVPERRLVEGEKQKTVWRRAPIPTRHIELPLTKEALEKGKELPQTPGIRVMGKIEAAEAPGIPPGSRALSIFVVNQRTPPDRASASDEAYIFQVVMTGEYPQGLLARPNRRGEDLEEWDDNVGDLQFRGRFEYAVGHGVSVETLDQEETPVTTVRTSWLPRHEVRRVVTHKEPSVTAEMEKLASLSDGASAKAALSPLVTAYRDWLDKQATREDGVDSKQRRETRDKLVEQARFVAKRIEEGIEILATNADVLTAFKLANDAMATSALRRSPERYNSEKRPTWHLFQLAFLLINIAGIANERHDDRDNVDLIFFPTGGGKTEAYLGVIAFTLLLRRQQGQQRDDKGLGVAVLLRYTLRLLTLDQLARAASLMCALEMQRRESPELLGDVRFSVGLWVGRTATANTLEQVRRDIVDYKNNAYKESPCPLTHCPWCGHALTRDSLTLVPSPKNPEGVVIGCVNFRCDFSARRNEEGIPVLFVDEQIYRELPSFLVATVDKFAMLPWRGETGMLFGRACARRGSRFFGPLDGSGGTALKAGLCPPELIVQDELHLISGPLGTMVGLYETAIEYLSSRKTEDGKLVRPKVIASTATVRRAREQIRALFGRPQMTLFPPPGIDDSESWFATVDHKHPGRLYVGVAAQGRAMKRILLEAYSTLLSGAQREYTALEDPKANPGENPADPYMTLAGYFNSLRELGGMRRLVEDDVRTRCSQAQDHAPVDHDPPHRFLWNRRIQLEPVELTSRESTGKIKTAKNRLNQPYGGKEEPRPVDVLLASNMISVGVDIDRLGLMVVAGQPKTTSEYIQASSRVGRQHPGLVVTCFNVAKPRDRSHYERFAAYHESFYRFVEATSLTPFSGPALDRGLAGTILAMTRLAALEMTPPSSAMLIEQHRDLGETAVRILAERGGAHASLSSAAHDLLVDELRKRGQDLLDAWETIVKEAREDAAAKRSYSRFDREKSAGKPLLFMVTEDEVPPEHSNEAKFAAPTSMRDVESSVHLWIDRRNLGGRS